MKTCIKINYLMLIFFSLLATSVSATNTFDNNEHSLSGVHGMALLMAEDELIASHMPLHHSVHAFQVLVKVSVSIELKAKLTALLKQNKLVTIEPEVFDLKNLMSGALTSFTAKVYAGHFERGGIVKIENVGFTIEQLLLTQAIKPVENGHYYQVNIKENNTLLVHRIGGLPSYDQLIWVKTALSSAAQTSAAQPSTKGLLIDNKEANTKAPLKRNDDFFNKHDFSWQQQVYLETRDFL